LTFAKEDQKEEGHKTPATTIKTSSSSSSSVSVSSSSLGEVGDLVFERKLYQATAGLSPFVRNHLLTRISRANASTIVDYILTMHSEIHLSDAYRRDNIVTLKKLAECTSDGSKLFQEMERQDIITFLDRYRKPESVDPFHKWIGAYNTIRTWLIRFFKWLYYPDIPPNRRPEPPIIQNIGRLKRREQTTYKPTDVWTLKDDVIFLKYCTSKREKFIGTSTPL
jgi:hypothetical protein